MDRKTVKIDESFDREIRRMQSTVERDGYMRIYPDPAVPTHRLTYAWTEDKMVLTIWQDARADDLSVDLQGLDKMLAGAANAPAVNQYIGLLCSALGLPTKPKKAKPLPSATPKTAEVVASEKLAHSQQLAKDHEQRQMDMSAAVDEFAGKSEADIKTMAAELGINTKGINRAGIIAKILGRKRDAGREAA